MISAVGISVIDHIMTLEGFKSCEGSFHCEDYIVEGGGMAATALCAASKLGAETRLFSKIGDDVNGALILEGLREFDVDSRGVVSVMGKQSTVSFVMVDCESGEKQFFSQWIKPAYNSDIDLDCSMLSDSSILLLDGHWTEGALQAAKWAKENGVPVVADFKRLYKNIESLFPYIDYFIVPKFFAEEISGKEDIMDILQELTTLQNGIPVITMGHEGVSYLDKGELKHIPAFKINSVDSTGAGDAFHGAFCHFLDKGFNLHRCLELSSAVGALNCRSHGGRKALPDRDELASFLKKHNVDTQSL